MITVAYPKAPILGRIKTGTKSTKGYPMKLDHFMISNGADATGIPQWDPYWQAKLGEKPREIPITVATDKIQGDNAIAFMYRVRWTRSHKMCMMTDEGTAVKYSYDPNGSLKEKTEVECNPATCPYAKKGECKINSTFHFILRDPENPGMVPLGGHHIYASSSWNSIKSLIGSLSEIKAMTGSLAMSPLLLRVREEFVEYTDAKGKHNSKVWIPYIIREIEVGAPIEVPREPEDNIEQKPAVYEEEILPPEEEEEIVPF